MMTNNFEVNLHNYYSSL